jgi:hypothetical protein
LKPEAVNSYVRTGKAPAKAEFGENSLKRNMEQTKTDFFAILVAFLVAVYGVVFQPVTVDSTRPTHLREQPNKGDSAVVDARLWDDPFVVFPEQTTRSIWPGSH